jgi:Protein of unknown function (DUF1488)
MPIARARDNYTIHADGIRFLMRDGSFEVICQIALETLSQFGDVMAVTDSVEVFKRERATIEHAASNLYDRTSRQDYEILTVTIADLASSD